MRTRLSSEAAAYLRTEAKYLRKFSQSAADQFLEAIRAARHNLQQFPEIGSVRDRLPIPGGENTGRG